MELTNEMAATIGRMLNDAESTTMALDLIEDHFDVSDETITLIARSLHTEPGALQVIAKSDEDKRKFEMVIDFLTDDNT